MIKELKRHDVQTTPFIASKSWNLLNTQNTDVVLTEDGLSEVALDFIDYQTSVSYPFLNSNCNIALEQQVQDVVLFEEGEDIQGIFYTNEARNNTGTYKRLIYHQINNSFYNKYQDPTKIFGLENIDIQSSKTKKFITSKFRVFTIPRDLFGEKIVEGSLSFIDNSLDDNYVIKDDTFGNLMAHDNLFSRIQEVKPFGNTLLDGTSSVACTSPIITSPTAPTELSASLQSEFTASLTWTDNSDNEDGFYIYRSLDSGSSWSIINTVGPNTTSYDDNTLALSSSYWFQVGAFNAVGITYSNTASLDTAFTWDDFTP